MRRVCGSVWRGKESKWGVVTEASLEKPMECLREHSTPTCETGRVVAGKWTTLKS